jgi:hypothetical protein
MLQPDNSPVILSVLFVDVNNSLFFIGDPQPDNITRIVLREYTCTKETEYTNGAAGSHPEL